MNKRSPPSCDSDRAIPASPSLKGKTRQAEALERVSKSLWNLLSEVFSCFMFFFSHAFHLFHPPFLLLVVRVARGRLVVQAHREWLRGGREEKPRAFIHGDEDPPLSEWREGREKMFGGRACNGLGVGHESPAVAK